MRNLSFYCLDTLLVCLLSGCVLYDFPRQANQADNRATPAAQSPVTVTRMVIQPTEIRIVEPTDPSRLVAGRYCQLTTVSVNNEIQENRSGASPRIEISKIAGVIVSINESDVVLDEVIRVEESLTMTTPPFARLPYLSRLFKSAAIYVKCIPIPGELRVSRDSIRQVLVIEPSAWPEFRRSGFVRVGVDFVDVDVPPDSGHAVHPAADDQTPSGVARLQDPDGTSY
jgi:hypothetical protein